MPRCQYFVMPALSDSETGTALFRSINVLAAFDLLVMSILARLQVHLPIANDSYRDFRLLLNGPQEHLSTLVTVRAPSWCVAPCARVRVYDFEAVAPDRGPAPTSPTRRNELINS